MTTQQSSELSSDTIFLCNKNNRGLSLNHQIYDVFGSKISELDGATHTSIEASAPLNSVGIRIKISESERDGFGIDNRTGGNDKKNPDAMCAMYTPPGIHFLPNMLLIIINQPVKRRAYSINGRADGSTPRPHHQQTDRPMHR